MDDFRKKVGERIVAARERKGWSSAQLAKQAGVKPSTLLRWESGGSAQEGEGLAAIADACEVSADYLLCRSPHQDPYPPSWWIVDMDFVEGVRSGSVRPTRDDYAGHPIPARPALMDSTQYQALMRKLRGGSK